MGVFSVVFVLVDIYSFEVLNRVDWECYKTGKYPTENGGNLSIGAFSDGFIPPELNAYHFFQDNLNVPKIIKTMFIVEASALFFVKAILVVCLPQVMKFHSEPKHY